MNYQKGSIAAGLGIALVIVLIVMAPFLVIDWQTGEHGRLTITSVDKNLFGTYTIYARNTESMSGNELNEIRYCIDASDTVLAQKAKEAVGKQNTKLVYPERRIGFVFFDKCSIAPIKDIIVQH